MAEPVQYHSEGSAAADPRSAAAGILPAHEIERLIAGGVIALARPVDDDQVQPASLDLRLGDVAYRVRASFLPGPDRTVADRLETLSLHKIDLTRGAVFETGCVYIVPLMESLGLSSDLSAAANPKSSTGRLDVFTRVIADRATEFDQIEAGYHGPLYAEISPRTFSLLARSGSRLSQIRFRLGTPDRSDDALKQLHERAALVSGGDANIDNGIALSVALAAENNGDIVGYRAKRHAGLIDIDLKSGYDIADFWEPITGQNSLVLDPDQFYILASKEAVNVPPTHAAEMVPYNPLVGEFRVHYAGFFDPGFGHDAAGGAGARAVLEVRSHDVPFILEDGQIVGRLVYEPLTGEPGTLYGQALGSNYQSQGLKLSKHFRVA